MGSPKVDGSLRTVIRLLFNYCNELKFHKEVTIASHYHEQFTFKHRKEKTPREASFLHPLHKHLCADQ